MKKRFLSLLIGLIMATPAFASVGVSPMRVDINANKVKGNYATASLDIKGDAKEPVRFKVYPGYFTINNKSEMVMYEKSDDPHYLKSRLRYVPSEFTVMQGKTQKLRLNIANLNTLPDGESRAVLFIEDMNPKEYTVPTGQSGIGAQLIVKTRMGIPIYVDKGKVTKVGEIEYLNVVKEKGSFYTDMKILSTGNSKIRYTCRMQIIDGKKLISEYSLPEKAVAHGGYYIDKSKIELGKLPSLGTYTLRAVLSYVDENGKKKNITKETQLELKQGEIK